MAITSNTYTGNGSNKLFSITFPYLDESDVDVYLNGTLQTITTQYSFANATTIEFVTAPANGATVRLDRSTDDSDNPATFFPGSSIKANDLNANFDQTLYVVQEINNNAVKLADPLYANKTYIDAADATKVNKSGDTMTGNLAMSGNRVTGLGTPSSDADSATKLYVDQRYGELGVPGLTRWRKIATAGQTVFSGVGEDGNTLAYSASRESVFINGAYQQRGVDYTANNGTSITVTPALLVGDVVDVHCVNNAAGVATDQASGVYFTQSGTGAATRTVDSKLKDVVSVKDFGAVADNTTNNTTAVQNAINSLGQYGGNVFVPDGAKFNLRSLTYPARFNLNYRIDDDLSQSQLPGFNHASSERALFSSNSSYPADPTGGIVNEWRMTAPFHPGMVVDVRKDLGSNISSLLGPGQSVNEPVRASWNITDEQAGRFRVAYENYLTPTLFSGVFIQGFKCVVRLNGIGTAQWSSVPTAGTLVTGITSGARGYVLSVAAGYTDLLWFNGRFVSGETVSDNNETTVATVTSVVFTETGNSWLAQDLKTGAWTVGDRPPGAGTETLNVAGNVKACPTRNGATNVPKQITDPAYVWSDDPEAASPNLVGLMYPTSGLAANRRLQMVRQDLSTSRGAIVPIGVSCVINSFLTAASDAVNVASITNPATGKYTITFTNNLITAYIPYAATSDAFYMQNWWTGVGFQAVGSVEVWVKDSTGAFANIPVGANVSLIGFGGDI